MDTKRIILTEGQSVKIRGSTDIDDDVQDTQIIRIKLDTEKAQTIEF